MSADQKVVVLVVVMVFALMLLIGVAYFVVALDDSFTEYCLVVNTK